MKQITDATKITKGDIITAYSGDRWTVLSKVPQENGTLNGHGEANYVIMARKDGYTRAADLIINQHLMAGELITVTRP